MCTKKRSGVRPEISFGFITGLKSAPIYTWGLGTLSVLGCLFILQFPESLSLLMSSAANLHELLFSNLCWLWNTSFFLSHKLPKKSSQLHFSLGRISFCTTASGNMDCRRWQTNPLQEYNPPHQHYQVCRTWNGTTEKSSSFVSRAWLTTSDLEKKINIRGIVEMHQIWSIVLSQFCTYPCHMRCWPNQNMYIFLIIKLEGR